MSRLWLPLCLLVPFSLTAPALAQEPQALPEAAPQAAPQVAPQVAVEVLQHADAGGQALAPGLVATFAWRCVLPDGTEVASSPADKPLRYRYQPHERRMIPGWSLAIADMREGERRRATVPAALAYGEAGVDGQIPPHSPLLFEIDLLALEPQPR